SPRAARARSTSPAAVAVGALRGVRSGGDLLEQRLRVERVEADPGGDLLARRLGALAEQVSQELARLLVAPPVLADLVDQVAAQLSGADPRSQVVGAVEARVHVGEVRVAPI